MEGLRGFAVLLVFVVHYTGMTRPWLGTGASSLYVFSEALHTIGNVGVDLFFVLSGYLIYGSLIARHQPFRTFMSRRIQRIYPTFLTVFAIYLILSWFLPAESKLPAILFDKIIYLIENLLLLPGLFPIQPLITVAWSLSYEMAYYLILPLLMILLNMRIRSPEWRSAFLINAAILIAVSCVFSGGPIRLIMFVVGMLIFESRKLGYDGRHGDVTGFAGLVVGLGCTLIPLEGELGPPPEGRQFVSVFLVVLRGLFQGGDCPVDTKGFFLDSSALVRKHELFLLSYPRTCAQGRVSRVACDVSQGRIFPADTLLVSFFPAYVPFDITACSGPVSHGRTSSVVE